MAQGWASSYFPVIVFVLVFLASVWCPAHAAPEIRFSFGRVQGVDLLAETTSKPYYAYFGIPYAQPPIGALRFRPPEPYRNTDANKIISSNNFRSSCIQAPGLTDDMSEDCLHLNVFVPTFAMNGQQKKVLVYIHGGAWVIGDAKEGRSSRLVTDYDVVVVTIQYRLGIMGFLSTLDDVVPGNNGLRDQIMALQWVRDNIARFGGEAEDVTVFGESAGAGSISILSVTPLAKGLFTKGIMQSGTFLAPWGNIRNALELTYNKAQSLGCLPTFYFPSKEAFHKSMISCVRSKPIDQINAPPTFIRNGSDVKLDLDLSHYVDFGPVVDGYIIPQDPFQIMEDKAYLEKTGAFNRSYIIGFNNNEGISIMQPFVYSVPGGNSGCDGRHKLPGPFHHVASPNTNIYLYLLDHYPKLKDPSEPLQGSNHGMDLIYTFDNNTAWDSIAFYAHTYTKEDAPVFDVFRRMLTSFAKTGSSPRAGQSAPFWPRYDLEYQYYMALSAAPEVRQKVYARRAALWAEYLPQMSRETFLQGVF